MAWGNKTNPAGSPVKSGGALSFIGAEMVINGNVLGSGDLHLDGTIEGDLACNQLILGTGGRVTGNITVKRATLAGSVEGAIHGGEIIVEKSARLSGDLSYDAISIESGARVEGRLTQRGGGDGALKLVAGGE